MFFVSTEGDDEAAEELELDGEDFPAEEADRLAPDEADSFSQPPPANPATKANTTTPISLRMGKSLH
jgi:hypothetical protein